MTEFKAAGVKIENKNKTLRLLWSLWISYKHMLPTLMFEKETVDLKEVTSTSLSN